MKNSDETAKRASTAEESDPCVSKKPRVEDEDETSMDEDDSDNDEYSWEVDPIDDIYAGVGSGIDYLNMREEEPEWDKDSYDGYECVFIPKERFATDEKYEVYCHDKIEAFENKGFLPDPWRSVDAMANLEDPWSQTTKREYLAEIASLCVKKLNEDKVCGICKYRERQSKSRMSVEALHHVYGSRVSQWASRGVSSQGHGFFRR